ncbi:chromate efflux transporter [Gemmatimonas sp.]|uniref:chromate efflux transporter n=1 Tax=Gemmatimonas sp. TaxID=1962908 RepID=UPI00286B0BFC|nr:chromate efflux transporter [Gemmatimonas sp.]
MPAPAAPTPRSPSRTEPGSWIEVARVFSRLGLTAFGGPAAHIAAMEDEFVQRRQWISRDEFVDLVGAANLIPGPNSTELAIHIGYRRAGWPGLFAAGVCFIVPAVLLVWALAMAYVQSGSRVNAPAILAGVQPVVLAVVVQALWRLRSSLVRSRWAALLAVASLVAVLAGVSEFAVLVLAIVTSLLIARATVSDDAEGGHRDLAALGAVAATVGAPMGAPAVFLSFAKIGSVLFGSGYVLLTFLRGEFVLRHAVLTDAQLLDAIAVGQVTPSPVFSAATFVGYLIAGHAGAAAATAGIFLPAFVGVALTAPYVARIRGSRRWSSALDGVNAASLALMASVVLLMARHLAPDPIALAILLVATAVLVFTRVGSGWVLLAGGCVGLLRALL